MMIARITRRRTGGSALYGGFTGGLSSTCQTGFSVAGKGSLTCSIAAVLSREFTCFDGIKVVIFTRLQNV